MISSNKTTVNLYFLAFGQSRVWTPDGTPVACRQVVELNAFLDERKISDFFISKILVSKMRSLSVYKKAKSYPTRPILTDEERMTPMLLCRVPSIPKQYSRERLNQLATPKVKTTHVKAFQRSPDGLYKLDI